MCFGIIGSEERMQIWEGNALLPGFLLSKRTAWIPVMPIPHILWEPATCAASLGAATPCCFKTEKQLICRIFPAQDIVYVILQVPTESTSKLCRVFKISAKPYYAVIFQTQTKTLILAKIRTFPTLKSWMLQTQCETVVIYILLWCRITASLRNASISRHNTIKFFNWVKYKACYFFLYISFIISWDLQILAASLFSSTRHTF